jgi:hypothetical protein
MSVRTPFKMLHEKLMAEEFWYMNTFSPLDSKPDDPSIYFSNIEFLLKEKGSSTDFVQETDLGQDEHNRRKTLISIGITGEKRSDILSDLLDMYATGIKTAKEAGING